MWVASFSSQLWFEMKGREGGKNPFCNCVFDFLSSITQKIVAAKPHSPLYFKYENANMYTSENTVSKKETNLSASSWLILLARKL